MFTADKSASFTIVDGSLSLEPQTERMVHEVPVNGLADAGRRRLRVEVVFATRGRPAVLSNVVAALRQQTLAPDTVTISCVTQADVGEVAEQAHIKVLFGAAGLARQRNLALRHLASDTEVVVFLDDDFVPHPTWFEQVERCFREDPTIAAVTGRVVADGVKGPGIAFEDACARLAAPDLRFSRRVRENYSPYGCNMAFRRSAIGGLSFDERLVLYGWLEDRDFGGALKLRGARRVQLESALGIHLGVKAGRLSGRRLGYSQVVNPIYLRSKGTMTLGSLLQHWFQNLTSNLVRSLWPEPHIDRHGRLIGNIVGLGELLQGIARPERAGSL